MQSYRRSWGLPHTHVFALQLLSDLQVSQGQVDCKLHLEVLPHHHVAQGSPWRHGMAHEGRSAEHQGWALPLRRPAWGHGAGDGSRDGQRQMLRTRKGLQECAWGSLGCEVRWATGILTSFSCCSHRYQTKDVLDKKDSTHLGIPFHFGCNCFNCCSSDPEQATSEEY